MAKRRLLWQLYPSYLLITLVSLLAVFLYASTAFKRFYVDEMAEGLESRARLLEMSVAEGLLRGDHDALDSRCKELAAGSGTRVTVILRSGRVVCDSERDPSRMENHADRPEIQAAFQGRPGRSIRYSYTLETDMMYVAVPIAPDGEAVAALRVSVAADAISAALRRIYTRIALAGLAVAIAAAIVSLAVSRKISRPLATLKSGAERFAAGDLSYKLARVGSEEIAALAEALNHMAGQLREKIETVTAQRGELEAVFSSMSEGVIALDRDENVIRLNDTAASLLNAESPNSRGKSLYEITRNVELLRFVRAALGTDEPHETEIALTDGDSARAIVIHAEPLRDAAASRIGTLLVLNDVTDLRRLEGVRRDFVANVSHEIRTPITSIRGFVETLLEGGAHESGDSERFLKIISRQVARLEAIVNDLLLLSQVEETGVRAGLAIESVPVADVLDAAVEVCQPAAAAGDVRIVTSCPNDLEGLVAPDLLAQALINLLDNAVKYSPGGSRVEISASRAGGGLVISVSDRGAGIEEEHLPRLFERFYRIDKARSRELGGTGLGLAIVKHIAQAHGGTVEVESAPGVGSTFSIHIPQAT